MSTKTSVFRSDIELLRGLAVILVVLFHLKISYFQSGFIGVDIFFVISGYLMASALCCDRPEKLLEFYERRARRVLPAALLIMMGFYLLSPFLFLPFEVKKIEDSYLATFFLAPNVVFWRDDEYFSDINFSPLLHYWSLGVELQYYLLFPLIVAFFKNNQRAYLILAIASLLLSIFVTNFSSKTAFFLLPTRLWEFFAGYFAFILYGRLRTDAIKHIDFYVLIALVALFITSMCMLPQNKYPGLYALIPVALSFIFVVMGVKDEVLQRMPGVSLIRWVGRLSYSIYLIHFPVIFYFLYSPFTKNVELSILQQIYAVVITLFLSLLSYRFIETPLRSKRVVSTKYFWRLMIALYLIGISIFVAFKYFNYFGQAYHPKEQAIFQAFSDQGQARCSKLQKLKELRESSCALLNIEGAKKRIYLVGDSQIDALKESFISEAEAADYTVRLNRDRCYLGLGQCSSSEIIKQIQRYQLTDVVMHGWDYSKFNYTDLAALANWTSNNNVNLHFIGPVPTYIESVPKFLYDELNKPATKDIRINYEQYESSVYEGYKNFVVSSRNIKNVYFYDPGLYFCPNGGMCMLEGEGGVYYFDSHHPTMSGAKLIKPMIQIIYSK